MHPEAGSADIFLHIRVVIGIILGLGITRLLTGVAAFVQHPGRQKLYWVHLAWVLSILITLVHFWWWEFWLVGLGHWNFGIYVFVIVFAILLFLLCALLFPTDIAEYAGYEDYFISRRRWFFGVFAATIVFDLVDTLLKGRPFRAVRRRVCAPRAGLSGALRHRHDHAEPLVSRRRRDRQPDLSGVLDPAPVLYPLLGSLACRGPGAVRLCRVA
jgi:hypothetical protein